ncbi:response regulator [Algoriphagus taiwanensis]|uniref:Response regulator n=1 Tax=Algoriphagus taiwanensis TaxID=1445656 RepID=A0ABQ6PZ19_9BACT|nr:response regulator [Algoriphagus taiwanensis]
MRRKLILVDDDKISLLITKKVIQSIITDDFFSEILIFDQPGLCLDQMAAISFQEEKICILLDLNMPLISGWDFLEKLSLIDPKENIPVVILTSSVSELDRERSKGYSRVKDFFSKPMSEALVKRIYQICMEME